MQYSIVNTNDLEGEIRLDPEYYHPQYLLADKLISEKKFQVLEKLSSKITDFGAYSQNNIVEYLDKGYAVFIRNQDVKNFFLEDSNRIYISKDVYNQLSLHLEKFDIVVQRVGSLGKAAIVLEKDLPSTANQNLAQIKVDKNLINPFYLITFLNCRYGIDYFERLQTGNVQPWLNLQQIKGLKIPLFSEGFQNKISSLVEASFLHSQQSKDEFLQAQRLLLADLGLLEWKPKHELFFVKNLNIFELNRFDAEFFQPKYDEIEVILKKYRNGWGLLKSQFEINKTQFDKVDDKEYEYLEIGGVDTSSGEINVENILGKELPANAKIKLNTGDVVVSKVRTYIGALSIIVRNGIIGSGAFTVFREIGKVNKETLFVLLKSLPYLEYSLKFNAGTSYPVLNDDDLLNYPLPLIDRNIQNTIRQKIDKSIEMKKKSVRLRELAKQSVEIAIEGNEKSSLKWLNNLEK